MPKIKTATIEINYADEGDSSKPVILFSNSLGANLDMWQPQVAHFRDRYRVISYDQRGHGQTEVPPGPYSFGELANDAVALMDALQIDRFHFVGLSMGGMTALDLAINHAARLRSVVPCNCVAGFPEEARQMWDERARSVAADGLAPLLEATLERWFTEPTRRARPDDMQAVRDMVMATPVPGYIGCCGAIKALDYSAQLASITTPCCFIAGTHDVGTPASAMREMHAAVTGSNYVELDTAHVSNLEDPDGFNQALEQFLSNL